MTVATRIVDKIINDLQCRKGIGDEYDMIEDDIREELRDDWVEIVEGVLLDQSTKSGVSGIEDNPRWNIP